MLLGGYQLYVAIFLLLLLFGDNPFKVEEEASKSGKKGYADFKRIVWHKSFEELLDSIRELSKIGYHIECADGVTRHIFPAILILCADYEEQYD